jgi:hypothetical protein
MNWFNQSVILAVLVTVTVHYQSFAFSPLSKPNTRTSVNSAPVLLSSCNAPTFNQRSRQRRLFRKDGAQCTTTSLKMAAEDFDETKYTEAAWSLISALTKVAEYYQAENVEAPFLLDVMLNPTTHNAGENAAAAKKVVEKVLTKAGTDIKALKAELDMYFSKQAKLSSESKQKVMGRTLQKVLDAARIGKSALGVR